MKGKCWNWS